MVSTETIAVPRKELLAMESLYGNEVYFNGWKDHSAEKQKKTSRLIQKVISQFHTTKRV